MSDDVFPGMPTGPSEHETRSGVERQDVDSLQTELNEQGRISAGMHNPFDKNRVTPPGSGDGAGGRVRVNRDWP